MPSLPRPVLIVVAGPTGAGKTGLTTYLLSKMHVADPTFVIVDDLVQADSEYHKGFRRIVKRRPSRSLSKTKRKRLDDLYFEVRGSTGCSANNRKQSASARALPKAYRDAIESEGCSREASVLLFRALHEREDVVFETTGSYVPSWLFKLAQDSHTVVMAYGVTDFETLLQRNRSRMQAMMDDFYGDNPSPMAPRLPDMTPSVFERRFAAIRGTLLKIVQDECVGTNACGGGRLDALHVFDTTFRPPRVVLVVKRALNVREKHSALRKLHALMIRTLS